MNAWAVLLSAQRYAAERVYYHDTLELTGIDGTQRPRPGDRVLVVIDAEPVRVVGLGRVDLAPGQTYDPDDPEAVDEPVPLVVTYTRRLFDQPLPAEHLVLDGQLTPLSAEAYDSLIARLDPPAQRRDWLVNLSLPIEAVSAAEAVRIFWSYIRELGPQELPTFVSPSEDELAMQVFVLGAETSEDPEGDE